MASSAALLNHSLFFVPPRPRPSLHSNISLSAPKALASPLSHYQNPSPRPQSPSSHLPRRPFGACLRVAATDPKTINGDEENQVSVDQHENSTEQEDLPSMKVLTQAYREALLDGDENSVSEIEAAIRVVENEKNSLSLKFGELTAEISSGKAKFLRLKADMENYRKRIEKDCLSLTSDVQGEVIESLLPLVDRFEKAKQHLKPETGKEKKIEASYQGIYKQFVEIMRSLRVAVVGTVGKPFDPSIHEAIAREESQTFKEGIVTQEVRRGFVLGDRLLRPASVKVSTGPGPGKVPPATGEPSEQTGAVAEPAEDTAATANSG